MLQGSILQQLEAAHQGGETSKRRLGFGIYFKNTLVSLCHALEDCILTAGSPPLVIAAFQLGKWYFEEADRYQEIATQSRQVVIMAADDAGFAEHSTSQITNVDLLSLNPDDPVAQEWHLMILSPVYKAMVLCQELSPADYGDDIPTEDRQRKFYGLWTFEPELVQEAVDLAIAHIGTYNPQLQAQLQDQVNAIAVDAQQANPQDLYPVVSRVVDYLQTNQQDLLPSISAATLDDNLLSNEVQAFLRMAQLIDLTDPKNPQATAEVTALVEMMAEILGLPGWQVKRLRLVSLLHRIGPLQQTESVLTSSRPATTEEPAEYCPLSCPLVPGAQAIRRMPQLRAIAQIITHQTEWWNGSGEPAGLVGDEIPLESRILGLVADFQRRVPSLTMPKTINDGKVDQWQADLDQALYECQRLMGDRWDPKLVELLSVIVNGIQQGLSLPLRTAKVSNGVWLLDPEMATRA
jgi:DICT domain-containing protein